jgi:hypothetical protein
VFCLLVGSVLLMLRKRTDLQPLIAIPALAILSAMTLGLLAHVVINGTATMTMGRWLPPFGISFTVDALGAFFAATSSLVALAAGIYGRSDVDHSGKRYGFYPFLLLIMAGVLGAFMTGDIFNLYVWFEVLLISSFGFWCWVRALAARWRRQIRFPQPHRHHAVPGCHRLSLRPVRHTQHGRHRRQGVRAARHRAADDAGHAVPSCLRHEGGGVSGQFLASRLLPHAQAGGVCPVCGPADQGRDLCAAEDSRHAVSV